MIISLDASCPMDYYGGILWQKTSLDRSVKYACNKLSNQFITGRMFTRYCDKNGRWSIPNYSHCRIIDISYSYRMYIWMTLSNTSENLQHNILENKVMIPSLM